MLNISPFSRGDPRTPQLQRHVGGAPVTVWLNNPQHDWLAPKMKWWKTAFNHGFIMDSETDSVLETEELKLQNSCFEVVSWPLPYRGYGDLTPRNSTSTNITCHKFSACFARITQKTVHHTMSFIWPTKKWGLWKEIIPNHGIYPIMHPHWGWFICRIRIHWTPWWASRLAMERDVMWPWFFEAPEVGVQLQNLKTGIYQI